MPRRKARKEATVAFHGGQLAKVFGRVQSPLIVKVGPFCRKGLSPLGEPCEQVA